MRALQNSTSGEGILSATLKSFEIVLQKGFTVPNYHASLADALRASPAV
jgi:hypothetical protein